MAYVAAETVSAVAQHVRSLSPGQDPNSKLRLRRLAHVADS